MIIAELSTLTTMYLVPYQPGIYVKKLNFDILAPFWTDTFNAPDQYVSTISVTDVIINQEKYAEARSYSDMIITESSFFYDETELYINLADDVAPYKIISAKYGSKNGYTDKDVIYIDDFEYLPLIKSIPSLLQQQDLQGYDMFSFVTGTAIFDNTGGLMDYVIDSDIFGARVDLYYLENGMIEADASDLVRLHSFYIEDYEVSLSEVRLTLQDYRKSQNTTIPTRFFSASLWPDIEDEYIGSPIPLVYGNVRIAPATPVSGDASGDVTFYIGDNVSAYGSVQVFSDDVWTTITETDIGGGEFIIAWEDCRSAIDGDIYPVRVLNVVGGSITSAADIIVDLNTRANGLPYTNTVYDVTEWETEAAKIAPIGVIFDSVVKLYEAIAEVQRSADVAFRYEVKADGLYTIRVDDWTREIVSHAEQVDIYDRQKMAVAINTELLIGIVKVNYAKEYQSGKRKSLVDESYKDDVEKRYNQTPFAEIDTLLDTEAEAQDRANWQLERYSTVRPVIDVTLMGTAWYSLRIYDMLAIEITPGSVNRDNRTIEGREYFGVWKCQVVGIDPDYNTQTVHISAVLAEKLSYEVA